LTNLYLVRHGQAGTRDAYDSLSDLGRRQARLLGEYFVAQGIEFTAAHCGTMSRQLQTAAEVSSAFAPSASSFPELNVDQCWNEFDLAQVYREIGPHLCESDPQFRNQYEEMLARIKESVGIPEAPVHRRWWPCDTRMVEAWIEGRFPYSGESWPQFCERVAGGIQRFNGNSVKSNILIFTSATPVGVSTSLALELKEERARQLAGVLFNASYTLLRQRDQKLMLFQFNAVPHLTTPELRTYR
jgi:broad specificity phosphatase PhoE